MVQGLLPSAMPSVFQGKPVNRWPRSHSAAASPKASAAMRLAPRDQTRRTAAKPAAKNRASTAGRPTTPSGIAQAN